MAKRKSTTAKPVDSPSRVAFDYIKSQMFRVVRADGAIGSVTPNGHIHFVLFSERPAIPRRLVHEMGTDGVLGPAIPEETESRQSIVRELDVDVFVNLETARSLAKWLDDRIGELSKRLDNEAPKSKTRRGMH